ncbi:urease accessory protein D [Oleiphilus messinensis]|uniref:Urease accessory protein UreD n=1 Tax=Oleiphilus messinensis TaxID=141451 RepID=A0A1Y0I2Q3_9GAMM|nr:urease accessory protein UreD [Oleiphilus messinensis]ARU54752.1 urease accessory protein D [Oleiphilus messinensis]
MHSVAACETKSPEGEQSSQGYGADRNWQATLELGFERRETKTILKTMRFVGPVRVQRPFYPEGELCHLYLLHPPGGLVSGDTLQVLVDSPQGTQALITTPSAGKVYRADSDLLPQTQINRLAVAGDLEWLPQENIVFDGANGILKTEIELSGAARFLGWDLVCLGRPASQLPFQSGSLQQILTVSRDGIPLLIDRFAVDGRQTKADAAMLNAHWGLGRQPVMGTLLASGFAQAPDALITELRAAFCPDNQALPSGGRVAFTFKSGLLIARYIGPKTEEAQQIFRQIWVMTRPVLFGRSALGPRIWNT